MTELSPVEAPPVPGPRSFQLATLQVLSESLQLSGQAAQCWPPTVGARSFLSANALEPSGDLIFGKEHRVVALPSS